MNLREAGEKALEALEHGGPAHRLRAMHALRTALAEAEEPVAWYYEREGESAISFAPDRDPDKPWQPLYTHPPRREPLTEEEIRRLFREAWTPESEADEVLSFSRAIERAHGIGGES